MSRKRDRRATRALTALMIVSLALAGGSSANGCGNDSFTSTPPIDGSADTGSIDAAPSDAASDAPIVPFDGGACDLTKKFGSLQPISELNTPLGAEQTARLTHDELNIYFQQRITDGSTLPDGAPGAKFQLMTASRLKIGDAWNKATPVPGVSRGAVDETDPTVNATNDLLYFDSPQLGDASNSDIWFSQRTVPAPFGVAVDQAPFNTAADESQPYLSATGLELFFRLRAANSSNFDLAHATRPATGNFIIDTANVFVNVNGPSLEGLPVISFDELTLYFTTDRSEAGGGGRQVWVATRAKIDDSFGSPSEVAELNTTPFTEPSWISDDGCRIYLTNMANGAADLYIATKPL